MVLRGHVPETRVISALTLSFQQKTTTTNVLNENMGHWIKTTWWKEKSNLSLKDDNDEDIFLAGFYLTPTQYRSYGDFPTLLMEEDLRCPNVHYFRHKEASE
jgi:hypothetical protein